MSVRLDISQLDTSNDDNEVQATNMPHTFVTFDISQLDKSNDTNGKQALNISCMLVTFDVSIRSRPSMETSPLKAQNK